MIHRKEGDCALGQEQQQRELLSEISNETTSNSNPLVSSIINECGDCPPSATFPCLSSVPRSEPTLNWRSQVSELTTRTRKRDLILCQSIFLITSLVTAIMNCAITIFGMGIGVGLILGDTLRPTSRFGEIDTTISATTVAATGNSTATAAESSTVAVVRPATSDCRAMIQRIPGTRSPTDTNGIRMHSNPTLPAQ